MAGCRWQSLCRGLWSGGRGIPSSRSIPAGIRGMVAAAHAQAAIWTGDQPVAASPEHIAVVVDRDAYEALSLLEVTQIPVPTDE